MDATYLPWAVREGAEIRPNCRVHGFETDESGAIRAVLYRDSSEPWHLVERRQRCRAVILAAGAIESPRLLLHAGLANGNGQVGRNFMAHVATQVWGTWDEPVRMNKGFPATVISEDMVRAPKADFSGGYITQSLGVMPVNWGQNVVHGRALLGDDLVRYLGRYNFAAGIGINGDCLPSPGNYLELSDEVGEDGIGKARVHFGYGPNETAMSRHAIATMTAAWQAAGAHDIWSAPRTAHTIGTCRMGDSKEENVVDGFGHSHEVANLWICDNSVFPSALAANPALTIMALSLRTARRFLERGGNG